MRNESNPWNVLTTQVQGMPAQCASPPCATTPPTTALAVLWCLILCIEGTHRGLAQSWHPSTLQALFAFAVPDCMFNEGFDVWSQGPTGQWICPIVSFVIWVGMLGQNVSHVYGQWLWAKPYSARQCINPSSRCWVTQEWGLNRKQKGLKSWSKDK